MYLRNIAHTLAMKNAFLFLISFAVLLSFASIGSAIAQNQSQNQLSSSLPENQTMATLTDSHQTIKQIKQQFQ